MFPSRTTVEEAVHDVIAMLRETIATHRSPTADHVGLLSLLEAASPAWPAVLKPKRHATDRRSALLSAPLFTSDAHPWPRDRTKHFEPVLQVSLAALGALRQEPLGAGWLQVWMADDGGLIRVVPEDAMKGEPLAPIPSGSAQDYHERLRFGCGRQVPAWLDEGHSIAGFGDPFFDYPGNELIGAIETIRETLQPSSHLDQTLSALQTRLEEPTEGMPSRFVHRAFGSVNESDMSAAAVPPVLFVLEEGEPLRESANGDDGVYVCYELDRGDGPSFSLQGRSLVTYGPAGGRPGEAMTLPLVVR